ncbi:MAG TPA: hypothetical protein VK968_07360, partial [Roseimicrobium sp.]|nr:hypothetical protein [Roseimicrobium sp.]
MNSRPILPQLTAAFLFAILGLGNALNTGAADSSKSKPSAKTLDWIQPSKDGTHFVAAASGKRFVAWGVNYDHDDDGRL